ncbi:MAG: hypothetical protein K1V92_14190, partial [Bacteroides acidifaciens]
LSAMCQSDIKVLPLLRFLAKQPTWQSICRQLAKFLQAKSMTSGQSGMFFYGRYLPNRYRACVLNSK